MPETKKQQKRSKPSLCNTQVLKELVAEFSYNLNSYLNLEIHGNWHLSSIVGALLLEFYWWDNIHLSILLHKFVQSYLDIKKKDVNQTQQNHGFESGFHNTCTAYLFKIEENLIAKPWAAICHHVMIADDSRRWN